MEGETRRRRAGDYDGMGTSSPESQEQQRSSDWEGPSRRRCSAKLICVVGVGVSIILTGILLLLPSPIQPVAFSLPPPPAWTGPMAPNDKMTQAERVFENQVLGPESIVRDGEFIYTGTMDGRILSIHKGEIITLARFGKGDNCGSFDSEPVCGRPLGMRMDKDGYLLVVDSYLGIFRVNVATGDAHQLLSSKNFMAGKQPKFLNDIEEGPDGTIYFTDSSTRWDRRHNRYLILEAEASGRLLAFNPWTLEVDELADGLAFANGLVLSSDKTHILVVETTKARIMRYHLTGPKEGQMDIFADNLPGFPDNIRQSGRGTYWVGFAAVRAAHKFSLADIAAPRPWLRSLLTKLLSQETIVSLLPKYGLLIELNKEGKVIRSLHDPTGGKVPSVSEAEEKNGVLYLGSYNLPFLSRVYLQN